MYWKFCHRIFCYFAIVTFGFSLSNVAVSQATTPNMSKAISEIMDDGTLVLEGGGKVVLSGIRWWTLFGGDNEASATPKELLGKYLADGLVDIYLEPSPRDRYGRMQAIVVSASGVNIQEDLLSLGMAMFWPNSAENTMLQTAENFARQNRIGRWGWSSSVVKCHNWDGFWTEGMAIVKGRVKEAKSFDNVIYLNFGEEWWRDFTIRADQKWAEANNWVAADYIGQLVEVRGWLYWQGGPQILLEHKTQIAPLGEEGGVGGLLSCPALEEAS